jgi:hypothetical protein
MARRASPSPEQPEEKPASVGGGRQRVESRPRSDWRADIPAVVQAAKKKLLDRIGGLRACVKARLEARAVGRQVGLENICGVGFGHKRRAGQPTGEWAVVVLVHRKTSDSARITAEAAIPPFIEVDGIKVPTDVCMVGPVAAHSYTQPQNPARPGTSVGPQNGETGTFGCMVMVRKDLPGDDRPIPCILSNCHVLALRPINSSSSLYLPSAKEHSGDARQGAKVMQPGYYDNTSPPNDVGILWDYSPLSVTTSSNTDVPSSFVDAAVAWTDDPRIHDAAVTPVFQDGSELDPDFSDPREGMEVIKQGRTTELTHGTIQNVGMDIVVGYGPQGTPPYAHFVYGVVIGGTGGKSFSDFGDSGSLVLEAATKKPVALLLGGDGTVTYANVIRDVKTALKIETFLNTSNINDYPEG